MQGRSFAPLLLAALCGLTIAPLSLAQTSARCRFSSFSAPSGYYLAGISGITSSGVIVGQLESKSFKDVAFVRYPDGSFTIYKAPNSYSTWFSKRSDRDVNVGAYQDNGYDGHVHGFTLHGSRFEAMNYPRAAATWLSGINKRGSIVGYYYLSDSTGRGFQFDNGRFTTFQYPGAVATTANAISDNGVIVGAYASGDVFYGFILQNKTYRRVIHPQGVLGTTLTDVNSSGVVVGEYDDADDYLHGFVYKNGKFQNLIYPGSRNTFAGGINDYGVIAGQVFFEDGSSKGYTAHCK
jgi:probable HAF family extracellular repeat protein